MNRTLNLLTQMLGGAMSLPTEGGEAGWSLLDTRDTCLGDIAISDPQFHHISLKNMMREGG